MTNPEQTSNNPNVSTGASSLQLSVTDNKDGTLGIVGAVIGVPAGTEISILIADAEGNTTSITAVADANGSYEALVTDTSMLKPGNLIATGKVNNLSTDAPFELEGMAALDPILITNSAMNGANQISLNGLAPSLKVNDVLTVVIRDKNGTSTDVTAVVQQGGVFSLTGISTQGLVDGPLVIDVQAQTTESNISVVNAATLQLATQLPAGADKTLLAIEDTGFALTASAFGYDASAGHTMTGIKIAGLPSLGTLKYNGVSVTLDQFVSVADLAAGKLVFLAAPNANGNAYANFMFKVLDSRSGINEDPVANTITFNVAAVNDAPVLANTSTLAYTENEAPKAINNAITVADFDSAGLTAANVAITTGFVMGQDVLSFTTTGEATMGNITGNYNPATGSMSLSSVGGTATLAQWQAALRAVAYSNSSDNPTAAARTVSYTVNDGLVNGNTVTSTINLTAVNDAPVLAIGSTLAYTENDTPKVINSGITVADLDNATLSTATVTIASGFVTGQDVLSFTTTGVATMGNISGTYNPATGVMSLLSTGNTATKAHWEAALRAVTYSNTSDNPNTAARTVSYAVNDGSLGSNTVTSTINLTAVNDAPLLSTGSTLSYTENEAPKAINNAINLADLDSATLSTATVSLTGGFVTGQDVLSFTNAGAATMGNIAGTYNPDTGVMGLFSTGNTATTAQWQAALRAVAYSNSSENPTTTARTVSFAVNDGLVTGNTVTSTINLTAVNDAPLLSNSGTLAYTENDAPKAIHTSITVSDVDSAGLSTATVTITTGLATNQDFLSFTNTGAAAMGDISGTYSSGTGVMNLSSASGTATAAQWQAALRAVTYNNSSDNPNTAARTVTYSVNDGGLNSNTVSATITLTAVNDSATFSGVTNIPINESNAAQTVGGTLTVTDLDSANTVTARNSVNGSAGYGKFTISTAGVWSYVMNTAQDQFVAGQTYDDTLTVTTADGTQQVIKVTITGTNDKPTVVSSTNSTGMITFTEDGAAVLARGGTITLADVDSANLQGATVRVVDWTTPNPVIAGDILSYNGALATASNITGSYVAATGTLTFSGSATQAQYQALLDTVTYSNARNDLPGGVRNVHYAVTDASGVTSDEAMTRVNVGRLNDAPLLDNSANLNLSDMTPTVFDAPPAQTAGVLVSTLVGGVTDPDLTLLNGTPVPKGIAVVGANPALGKVFFSVDGGVKWFTPTFALSGTAALVLKADSDTRVYFRPNPGVEGTIADALTIRAWDGTDNKSSLLGTNNVVQHNISSVLGGINPYSLATDTVSLKVASVASAGLAGTSGPNTLNGTAGNDVILGGGGADVINAGTGNDRVVLNDSNVTELSLANLANINGGGGVNILKLIGTELTLDLTNATVAGKVDNFSTVDITSNVNNMLKLNLLNVQNFSGATNNPSTTAVDESKMMVVLGDVGDAVVLQDAAGWAVVNGLEGASLGALYGADYGFSSSRQYSQYSKEGASLFVDQLVPVGDIVGTSGNDTLAGTNNADVIFGNGGADTIAAGPGKDTVILSASSLTALAATTNTAAVDGGTDINTLKLSGINLNLDLTNPTVIGKLDNFTVIDMKQGSGNKFKLGLAEVLALAGGTDNAATVGVDESKMLVLQGNGGAALNKLELKDGLTWTAVTNLGGTGLQTTYGAEYGFEVGRSYTQYTSGAANLFVDQTLLQVMV
jgi:VCBS repeat-containing protein